VPPGGQPSQANYGPLPKPRPKKWYDDLFFSRWVTRPDPAEAIARGPLFKHVNTGTRLLDRLTGPGIGLSEQKAIERLRGLFVGPDDEQSCAVVTLTEEGKRDLRVTIAKLYSVTESELGLPPDRVKMGGPPVDNILGTKRRTMYAKVSRNGDRFASDSFLRLFDFPVPRASSAGRVTSIVPQQFLFMMNSPFMAERAKALTARLQSEAKDDAGRIELAYRLLYGRSPKAEEKQLGLEFVSDTADKADKTAVSRWQQYAQVLLSSNEFMYVR
ncbi:MAG: DUF1553 domain-containing protein, partial [Planctomycetes bacterium]|nr:DUF1553 domain-containing protein [Planctomycetota bacterium]